MKRFRQLIKSLLVVLTCVLMLLSVGTYNVHASQQQQQQQQGQGYKPKYTLVYPDGSTKVCESYEEAEKLLDKEVLLYSGDKAITDKDGKITLKDWMTEGDIRIVETEAPEGYEIIKKEQTVNLSEGKANFVNKEKPKLEEPKKETPRPVSIPKTGDVYNVLHELLIRIIDFVKPYGEEQLQEQHVPPLPNITEENTTIVEPQYEKGNFIINKVDEEGKPLKGAKFEVYGKPKLYVSVVIAKLYTPIQESQLQEYLPSPLNLIKSMIVKTVNAEDYTPPTPDEYYIQTNITIRISGVGDEIVTLEKPNVEFNLEVGKTYTVTEVTNLEGQKWDDYKYQSYLYEYQITIAMDGSLSSNPDTAQWKWLVSDDKEIVYKVVDTTAIQELLPYPPFVEVSTVGNVLKIQNEAGFLPPPKCDEPCPPTEPCPLDGDNEQEQKCEPQQPEPEQQE